MAFVWQRLSDGDSASLMGLYHEHVRKELLPLFQSPPRVVLDVGCANGATSVWLKGQYPGLVAYGIELNQRAADIAAKRLDKVFTQTLEQVIDAGEVGAHSVDTVLLADVLEHMENPWGALTALHAVLAADAQLLISLPNTRNLHLINDLAQGKWSYASEGLLDITHLRFFTLAEARRMLDETGYRIKSVSFVGDARVQQPQPAKYLEEWSAGKVVLKNVTVEEQRELAALQILICAVPKKIGEAEGVESKGMSDILPPQTEEENHQKYSHEEEYWAWSGMRKLMPKDRVWMAEAINAWGGTAPVFHLAVILLPGQEGWIKENISTLRTQIYPRWRMTVIAFSELPDAMQLPAGVAWHELGDDEDTTDVLNALAAGSGDAWFGIWDTGDMLDADTLFHMARLIMTHPSWRMVYSDEDVLDSDLRRSNPHFKPDFNLDLLRSFPYLGGLTFFHREVFTELGGFIHDLEGAEEYDLALKTYERWGAAAIGHNPLVGYHRRAGSGHTFATQDEIWTNCQHVLQHHLDRSAPGAVAERAKVAPFFKVVYPLSVKPLVSIIIPTKDRPDLLKRCMKSLLGLTTYENFEVLIVDNNTTNSEALAYMEELSQDARVKVLRYPYPFNYSAENNFAAKQAAGEYLLLLNNDTEVIDGEWLTTLMRYGSRDDVGVVGPLLLFENGQVQHAGVVLALGYRPAEHIFIGMSPDEAGYFWRLQLTQNYSAVTAACLLVRKSLYEAVQGLDEEMFSVNFNDIDLCLKIGELGYRIVWTPDTRLIHLGSQSQHTVMDQAHEEEVRRSLAEDAAMYRKWMPAMLREPAWNRQLARGERKAVLEMDTMLTEDPAWRPRKRILAHPTDKAGRGLYRIVTPSRALDEAGLAMAWPTERIYGEYEIAKLNPDSIVLQEQTHAHQLEAIKRYRNFSNALLVFELDDLITELNRRNFPHMRGYDNQEKASELAQALRLSDRFVVTTPYLKEAYGHLCNDIKIVPNYLQRKAWGRLRAERRACEKPRVGWAGGSSHRGDLEMITDVVRILADEVDWIFFGMCPDSLKPYVKEYYTGVSLGAYPTQLANLDLDLALAPLEVHDFNRAKSSLRLLEYGVLGYPVICTDLDPYQGEFPVTRVSNATEDWVQAIREAVSDRDRLAQQGDKLKAHIEKHFMLEDHLDVWLRAWTA